MSDSMNYLANVRCPHCQSHLLVAVSGFGGELATRKKQCGKCKKEFYAHLLARTSNVEEIDDGQISAMKSRIKHLRSERKQTLAQLLIKHETAVRLYRESLEEASRMREKYETN